VPEAISKQRAAPSNSPALGVGHLSSDQRERLYTSLLIAVLGTVMPKGGSLTVSKSNLRSASQSSLSVESDGHGGLSMRLHRRNGH
jgi:hypothetical protein